MDELLCYMKVFPLLFGFFCNSIASFRCAQSKSKKRPVSPQTHMMNAKTFVGAASLRRMPFEVDAAMFSDLSKVHGSILRDLLIEKINSYGASGIRQSFIVSYLTKRRNLNSIGLNYFARKLRTVWSDIFVVQARGTRGIILLILRKQSQ